MNPQLPVFGSDKPNVNTCVLDGEDYLEWYDHVYDKKSAFKDERHARHFAEAKDNEWDYFCYCGTPIQVREHGSWNGDFGWEITCPTCGFLFDED